MRWFVTFSSARASYQANSAPPVQTTPQQTSRAPPASTNKLPAYFKTRQPSFRQATARFDGHACAIDGTRLDTVSIERDDPNTVERTGKVRGMPSETCTVKIAPDGKTLTMTVKRAYNGANYAGTQIYWRQ